MKYPKSYAGVKKIFTAEVLKIFAYVLLFGAIISAAILAASLGIESLTDTSRIVDFSQAAQTGALTTTIIMLVFVLAALILMMTSSILYLIGIIQPIKEEPSFRFALVCVIVAYVSYIVGSILTSNSNTTMASLCNSIGSLFEFLVTINVIHGIRNLADRLNNGAVAAKGTTIFKVMIAMYSLIIIAYVTGIFTPLLSIIAYVISVILGIITYIIFLSYLSNAKKMLAKS